MGGGGKWGFICTYVCGPWGKSCLKRPNSKVGNFDNYVLNGENGTYSLFFFKLTRKIMEVLERLKYIVAIFT